MANMTVASNMTVVMEHTRMPRIHRGRRCFVKSCNNYQRDANREPGEIRFFSVPDDPMLREEFKQLCGRSGETAKCSVICSRHFTEADLTKSGHLRRGALPTLNLLNEDWDLDKPIKVGKKWKGNLCAVHGCRSYTGERHTMNLHFFYCPQKALSEQSEEAMDLYNKWFDACGRSDIEQFSKYHRVCSLHFEPEDIDVDTNRAKLRPTAYPKRYLPGGDDGEPPTQALREAAALEGGRTSPDIARMMQLRLEKSCKDQWRIIRSPYFKPALPADGGTPWVVFEREEDYINFARVRKGSASNLAHSACVDFIRFELDMSVSLASGSHAVMPEKYAPLLEEGCRAMTAKQVEDIFRFDFQVCEVVLVIQTAPISVVDQAFLVSLGNNVYESPAELEGEQTEETEEADEEPGEAVAEEETTEEHQEVEAEPADMESHVPIEETEEEIAPVVTPIKRRGRKGTPVTRATKRNRNEDSD